MYVELSLICLLTLVLIHTRTDDTQVKQLLRESQHMSEHTEERKTTLAWRKRPSAGFVLAHFTLQPNTQFEDYQQVSLQQRDVFQVFAPSSLSRQHGLFIIL